MGNNNLWEYSFDEKIATPKSVLEQQAKFFQEQTNNQLEVDILTYFGKTRSTKHNLSLTEVRQLMSQKDKFTIKFKIIAPTLDNFSFTLLEVYHDFSNIYPCDIYFSLENLTFENVADTQFEQVLKEIFNHNKTKSVIWNLLSMLQ